MRAVIVDDEEAARGLLRKRLCDFPFVEIIGEAANELEAIEIINETHPDLVFLDIQMTVLSGFDVLLYLKIRPLIIFCTAYDQFAVRAFEEHAVDYLLKPVETERLGKSLERARNELQRDQALQRLAFMRPKLERLVGEVGNRRIIVPLTEVVWFGKDGRYTICLTREKTQVMVDLTIDYLEQQLGEANYFRINRATILPRSQILSFEVREGHTLAHLANGEHLKVSRRRAKAFAQWFHQVAGPK